MGGLIQISIVTAHMPVVIVLIGENNLKVKLLLFHFSFLLPLPLHATAVVLLVANVLLPLLANQPTTPPHLELK